MWRWGRGLDHAFLAGARLSDCVYADGLRLLRHTQTPPSTMNQPTREPEPLRRGKAFHRRVQDDWEQTAQGAIHVERTIPLLPSGKRVRRGRMDLFVSEHDGMVAVVEIKATDWDRIKHIQKALSSHQRQTWKYIERYLDGEQLDVSAGIVYPTAPSTPGLKDRVESYLNEYGVQVVWYDDD